MTASVTMSPSLSDMPERKEYRSNCTDSAEHHCDATRRSVLCRPQDAVCLVLGKATFLWMSWRPTPEKGDETSVYSECQNSAFDLNHEDDRLGDAD